MADRSTNSQFCLGLQTRIETAYRESGYRLGWRLLCSPPSVLDGASVAFIGLNPGGAIRRNDHGELAMSRGSAYVDEVWDRASAAGENPLQKQIRALFFGLSLVPEDVLTGNLVPFRSPSWASLENKDSALLFGEQLWREILDRSGPELVIGMGRELADPLRRILGSPELSKVDVNWGRVKALKGRFPGGQLVVLPHLSRFSIVARPQSAAAMKTLFGDRWNVA